MNDARFFGFRREDFHDDTGWRQSDYDALVKRLEAAWPAGCNQNCKQGRACDCVLNVEENSVIPANRRAVSGRTYNSPWDAGIVGPGASITRPPEQHKVRDIVFGLLMAAVVCATLYVLLAYRAAP